MKISIGLRLFLSVLLAILAVTASAVWLLRQTVLEGFGDYAVQIELDRLEGLSNDLARRYADAGGWRFVPRRDTARRAWLGEELARRQALRTGALAPVAPALPAAPAAPAAPALPAAPAAHVSPPSAPPSASAAAVQSPPSPPPAVAPPAPPGVPLPPLPPPAPGMQGASLQERVTLLDAGGAWLAGRPPGALPLVRRAILADGRTVGYLAVARSSGPTDALAYAFLEGLSASLWPIVGAGVLLSALAASLLAVHFRRPIGRLALGAQALADGRFDTRLPVERSDELGELAHHFNLLAARLDDAERSRRQWVADTSHELRTPLAVLRAQLEAIQDGVRQADPDHIAAMLRQVLALNRLIDELYALARADVGALECKQERVDLWALAGEEAAAFTSRFEAAGLTLELGPAPANAYVLADADRMRQVLRNLLENSLRYTTAGGRVLLSAQAGGGRLLIAIDDSAPGVPGDALARLGERFYRVDASRSRAGGGAGLGLALCRRLVEAQGGTLAFAHSPLGGLRVAVAMPLEAA
ncbi:ATP-binding protein [Massilia sp. YIM B02769]|uniref:ATP-binding protein n=1 Tax=unclassified Massilia TaxID=2609279 RepID=UPI0025B6E067|nr:MULTISPECIES: ATP-binding protein [unclassified Massilia]MDN4058892.1 ATP-binding protein [Massilia sp. YIM B02769]